MRDGEMARDHEDEMAFGAPGQKRPPLRIGQVQTGANAGTVPSVDGMTLRYALREFLVPPSGAGSFVLIGSHSFRCGLRCFVPAVSVS